MMQCYEILFKKEGLIIAKLKHVNFSPAFVLRNRISPSDFIHGRWFEDHPDEIVLKMGRRKKRFKGIILAESESTAKRFLIENAVMDEGKIDTLLERLRTIRHHNLRYFSWRGREFLSSDNEYTDGRVLCGWVREDKIISSVMAGWGFAERRRFRRSEWSGDYFYLHSIDNTSGRANFRKVPAVSEIPENIIRWLSKGFVFYPSMSGLIDVVPFPPYDIRFAVKLYPLSIIKKVKQEKPPSLFDTPCIIKTFLPVSQVPLIDISPGELKSVLNNIVDNVYDPEFPNPHWATDYKFILEHSTGYLLFVKPGKFGIK